MKIFITGTDTNIGKTYISAKILEQFAKLNLKTIGIKPIASDCKLIGNKLINDDALALQNAATIKLDYDVINPLAFQPAIAPHIAAELLQQKLSVAALNQLMQSALSHPADLHLIEGFGGWHAPLNDKETMADFAIHQQFKIILIVGIRLGCLNHAILTQQAIKAAGLHCIGWIANCIDPEMEFVAENIMTLKKYLDTPCLDIVAWQSDLSTSTHTALVNAMNRQS